MGYYTEFMIIEDNADLIQNLLFEGVTYRHINWYTFEEDVKRFAKENPTARGIVEGVGEESPDHWRCYIGNGVAEIVQTKMVFPEPEWWSSGK
ncbi:MAG: hypothetical protein WCY93_07840 [Anaerolineaceae bacterium]